MAAFYWSSAMDLNLFARPNFNRPWRLSSSIQGPTPDSSTTKAIAKTNAKFYRVKLETLSGCKLGVSWYPDFGYNAQGGQGDGWAEQLEDGRLKVEFDSSKIFIPALDFSTTRFLGVPLPPPLRIDVEPKLLKGCIDPDEGQVELNLIAEFLFTAGPLYRAPGLLVDTVLTTGYSEGQRRSGQGCKLDEDGRCKLVGVSQLNRVNDPFLDAFLTLPTDCKAELRAKFLIEEER